MGAHHHRRIDVTGDGHLQSIGVPVEGTALAVQLLILGFVEVRAVQPMGCVKGKFFGDGNHGVHFRTLLM